MLINAATFTRQAVGKSLPAADQHGDRHHQQEPMDPIRVAQTTVLQLNDPRLLVAKQMLTAKKLGVTPDQI